MRPGVPFPWDHAHRADRLGVVAHAQDIGQSGTRPDWTQRQQGGGGACGGMRGRPGRGYLWHGPARAATTVSVAGRSPPGCWALWKGRREAALRSLGRAQGTRDTQQTRWTETDMDSCGDRCHTVPQGSALEGHVYRWTVTVPPSQLGPRGPCHMAQDGREPWEHPTVQADRQAPAAQMCLDAGLCPSPPGSWLGSSGPRAWGRLRLARLCLCFSCLARIRFILWVVGGDAECQAARGASALPGGGALTVFSAAPGTSPLPCGGLRCS